MAFLQNLTNIGYQMFVTWPVKLGPVNVLPVLFMGVIDIFVFRDILENYSVDRRMSNISEAIRVVLDNNHGLQING